MEFGFDGRVVAGLAGTLSLEGSRDDIRVNTIAPVAGIAMTRDAMAPDKFDTFMPEHVVPVAICLVSENAPRNMIIGAGAGFFHAVNVTMTGSALLKARAVKRDLTCASSTDNSADREQRSSPLISRG